MKKHLLWLHGVALLLLLASWFCKWNIGWSLVASIEIGLKLVIGISGLVLFFKAKDWIKLYLLIYPLSLGMIVLAFMVRGMIGAMLFHMVYSQFMYEPEISRKGQLVLKGTLREGIMSRCCTYRICREYGGVVEFCHEKNDYQVSAGRVKDFEMIPRSDSLRLKFEKDGVVIWDTVVLK
jgi:hypothetical protein